MSAKTHGIEPYFHGIESQQGKLDTQISSFLNNNYDTENHNENVQYDIVHQKKEQTFYFI